MNADSQTISSPMKAACGAQIVPMRTGATEHVGVARITTSLAINLWWLILSAAMIGSVRTVRAVRSKK